MSSSSTEHAAGPPHIHHMSPVTAYHAAKLGMWLFLATEVLLFGGLFAAYALFRAVYPDEFHAASQQLDVTLGGINTAVLIVSSFFAAWAMDAAQHGDNKAVVKRLAVTILCGFGFLIIKYLEYSHKFHVSHDSINEMANAGKAALDAVVVFPSIEGFNEPGSGVIRAYKCFFGLYYCMTGLHALHVIFGMGFLGWVMWLAKNERFTTDYYTPAELGALYWHLVDLIWIYLFPLLYLIG